MIPMNHKEKSTNNTTSTTKTMNGMIPKTTEVARCLCDESGWVFIVATGRSKSTTALAMLNAVPGVVMLGEHRPKPMKGRRENPVHGLREVASPRLDA